MSEAPGDKQRESALEGQDEKIPTRNCVPQAESRREAVAHDQNLNVRKKRKLECENSVARLPIQTDEKDLLSPPSTSSSRSDIKISMVIQMDSTPRIEVDDEDSLLDWTTREKHRITKSLRKMLNVQDMISNQGTNIHEPRIRFPKPLSETLAHRTSVENRRNWTLAFKFDKENIFKQERRLQDIDRCNKLLNYCQTIVKSQNIEFKEAKVEKGGIICKFPIFSSEILKVLQARIPLLGGFKRLFLDDKINCMPTVSIIRNYKPSLLVGSGKPYSVDVILTATYFAAVFMITTLLERDDWKTEVFRILRIQAFPIHCNIRRIHKVQRIGDCMPTLRDLITVFNRFRTGLSSPLVLAMIVEYWAFDITPDSSFQWKRKSEAILGPRCILFNRLFNDISVLKNDGTTAIVKRFDSHCIPSGESRIKWFDGFETKLEVECGVEPSFLPGIFFTTLSVLSGSKSDVDEKIREHRVLLCNAYQGWEDRNSGAPLGTWGFITRTDCKVECILRSTNPGPGSGSGLAFTLGSDAVSFEAAVVGFWPMKLSKDNLSARFHLSVDYDPEYNWYTQAWDIGRKVIDFSGLSNRRKRLKIKPNTDFDALYKMFDDEAESNITERSRSTNASSCTMTMIES